MQLFASVYKRGESGGVQWRFGVIPAVSADPGVLQARGRAGPFPGVLVQRGHDEVFGGLADPAEVLLRKAEVQPADVDAGLLQTLVQKRGHAAEHDVGQHPCAPNVRGQGDRGTLDELRGGELGVAQEEMDVAVAGDLYSITQICELHTGHRHVEVHQQVFRLRKRKELISCTAQRYSSFIKSALVVKVDKIRFKI